MTQIVLPYDQTPQSKQECVESFSLYENLHNPQKGEPAIGMIKLGLESIYAELYHGGQITTGAILMREKAKKIGLPVLWDAKVRDIGNTVKGAVTNIALSGADWMTLDSTVSQSARRAAVAARNRVAGNFGPMLSIFGVSILTDIDDDECIRTYGAPVLEKVCYLAERLIEDGIDGIVCSGWELEELAKRGMAKELETLVPGLRSEWAPANDQKRVMTPSMAAALGASFAVIGRQITDTADPYASALRTKAEMAAA